MTKTIRLRHLAEVNPPTPAFDNIAEDQAVTFAPLETVWADGRLDLSRRRPKAEVSSGYVRFRGGDILSPKVTPTFQAGRSALIPLTLETYVGAASTEVHVVRAKPGIDARFVRYGLLAKPFLDLGVASFQGVAGLQRVSDEVLRNLPLIRVPALEQRRIADFLDDQVARIDNIIAARRGQLGLLELEHRALRDDITLGRHASGVRTEAQWAPFGDIPADWKQTLLRSVPSILQTGPFGSQLHSDEYVDDGWPVVNPAGLRDSRIIRVPGMSVPVGVRDRLPRHMLRTGDVVFGRRGELGRAGLVTGEEEGWLLGTGSLMVRIRRDSPLTPAYLVRLLETAALRYYFDSVSVGSTMANLNVPILAAMPLLLPPVHVQDQIVAMVDMTAGQSAARSAALSKAPNCSTS